jgi:hypothetical protein
MAAAGAAIGAGVGAVAGATAGGIVHGTSAKNDEQLQKAVEVLAEDITQTGDLSEEHIKQVLMGEGVQADEAAIMAEEFAKDTDALVEFSNSLVATTAQQKAYY